jgi:DNA-binding transcriptional regulator YiaG
MDTATIRLFRKRAIAPLPEPAVRRQLREAAHIPTRDMGALVGVTSTSVSRWETGAREPRGAIRARYAEVLETLQHLEEQPTVSPKGGDAA